MADTTTWTPISAPTDFQDDAVFNIDFKTKTVQVLVEQPIVAGENLSQFIKFQAPRFYDNIDLTNMSVNILYVSPAGNKGISAAINTEYSDDMIRCGWLVPYAACPEKGTLLFVLEFVGADYVLKTTIGSTPVLDSINDADVIPEPVEQAWYITLQANVSAALQEAQTALGRIESIFNALSTPMSAGTAAEMVDETAIYVYTGSETGYTYGNWYYYDGTEWVSGGTYASTTLVTDRTLSQSGQAADAKETGDRIERTNEVLGCEVAFTETLGYINASGGIGTPSSYGREVYTDEYIPVTVGDTLRFYMYSIANAYVMWSKIALYDANKNFIRRVDLASGTYTDVTNYWSNTEKDVAYIRYTYRTGTPAAGQWVYTKVERMVVSDINAHVAFNKAYTTNNRYINTNVAIGNTVSFTPVVFSRFACAIIPCVAGDVFTITGRGAGSARLWAFVNSNKELISKSIGNAFALNEILTAPTDSADLIVNFDMLTEYSCYKGVNVSVTNDVRTAVIQQGVVHNLPSNIVAMPTVDFYATVQDSTAAGAKPTIYNNGEWFVITYGENLDGTGTDIPKVTESGVLAMKYKKFRLSNGVESDVSYGTIAQKGATYTDYQGNTTTSVGGWGLPSGVNNMQYFTTAYTGNYSYNGEANYGMTPCCCTVGITNDGTVTFGTIKELTLDIGGTVGKFDVTRLSPENNSYLLYMTTAAPYYSTLGYKWMIPVIGGIAYFTSDNGIDWTYQWTLETPYQAQCEVMCVAESGGDIVFAARTQTRNSTTSDTLYIGKVSQAGTPSANYKLPFYASRAFLIRNQNDILLFYTPASKNTNECIRIIIENGSNLYFWKWFTIWQKATWYLTCYNSVFPERFSKMYLCGGNGEAGSTAGMTFVALSFDSTSPRRPTEVQFAIT